MCVKCHTETAGPFVFEHPPVKTEGCVSCHLPHGGYNARLLTKSNVNTLCLQCHTVNDNFTAPGIPSFHNQAVQYRGLHDLPHAGARLECKCCLLQVKATIMTKSLSINSQPHSGQKNHGGKSMGSLRVAVTALAIGLVALTSAAQNATPNTTPAAADKEKVVGGYAIHQSTDLGGHSRYSGSTSMWDTLVNLQSGPRILSFSLNMRSVDQHKTPLFDTLMTANYGYGGDPINTTVLRVSKGRIYDFSGSFRRDRQYFDYDLLANPLIPRERSPLCARSDFSAPFQHGSPNERWRYDDHAAVTGQFPRWVLAECS